MQLAELIQNSIEARASEIEIFFNVNDYSNTITMKVSDNGLGMNDDFIKEVYNPFKTSRKSRNIGLGLAFLKQEVDQCDGKLIIDSKVNKGCSIEAIFKKDHLDLPQIGDLDTTIMCFMTEADRINFSFIYQVNDKIFIFDTREIKKILGSEININSNQVIVWIKDYLKHNMEGIEK